MTIRKIISSSEEPPVDEIVLETNMLDLVSVIVKSDSTTDIKRQTIVSRKQQLNNFELIIDFECNVIE